MFQFQEHYEEKQDATDSPTLLDCPASHNVLTETRSKTIMQGLQIKCGPRLCVSGVFKKNIN